MWRRLSGRAPPRAVTGQTRYTGDRWPRFSPANVIVVVQYFEVTRFVLVDVDQRVYPGLVASDVISALGSPVTVDACGQFEVWSYPPGSDGHDQLNRRIDDWLASG